MFRAGAPALSDSLGHRDRAIAEAISLAFMAGIATTAVTVEMDTATAAPGSESVHPAPAGFPEPVADLAGPAGEARRGSGVAPTLRGGRGEHPSGARLDLQVRAPVRLAQPAAAGRRGRRR